MIGTVSTAVIAVGPGPAHRSNNSGDSKVMGGPKKEEAAVVLFKCAPDFLLKCEVVKASFASNDGLVVFVDMLCLAADW